VQLRKHQTRELVFALTERLEQIAKRVPVMDGTVENVMFCERLDILRGAISAVLKRAPAKWKESHR
jgi:hypothetical protein